MIPAAYAVLDLNAAAHNLEKSAVLCARRKNYGGYQG